MLERRFIQQIFSCPYYIIITQSIAVRHSVWAGKIVGKADKKKMGNATLHKELFKKNSMLQYHANSKSLNYLFDHSSKRGEKPVPIFFPRKL